MMAKPAHQPYAFNPADLDAIRGFDGSVHGYSAPRTDSDAYIRNADGSISPKPGTPAYEALTKRPQTQVVTPALPGDLTPRAESPYDPVFQYGNGITRNLGPRYKVDAERAMAEMAVEKARFEMEQARDQAQQQADMQRWMFEQMRRNPYGANIRDLIYGAGGK